MSKIVIHYCAACRGSIQNSKLRHSRTPQGLKCQDCRIAASDTLPPNRKPRTVLWIVAAIILATAVGLILNAALFDSGRDPGPGVNAASGVPKSDRSSKPRNGPALRPSSTEDVSAESTAKAAGSTLEATPDSDEQPPNLPTVSTAVAQASRNQPSSRDEPKLVKEFSLPPGTVIEAVVANPGRGWMAVTSMGGHMTLLDLNTQEELHRFTGVIPRAPQPRRSFSSVATIVPVGGVRWEFATFGPDGASLALYDQAGVRIFNVGQFREVQMVKTQPYLRGAFSADFSTALLPRDLFTMWDLKTGQQKSHSLQYHRGVYSGQVCCALSSTGGLTAVAREWAGSRVSATDRFRQIRIHDVQDGLLVATLPKGSQGALSLQLDFAGNDRRILSREYRSASVWDIRLEKLVFETPRGTPVWDATTDRDMRQVLAMGTENRIVIWDLEEGRLLHTIEVDLRNGRRRICMDASGRELLCFADSKARLWRLPDRELPKSVAVAAPVVDRRELPSVAEVLGSPVQHWFGLGQSSEMGLPAIPTVTSISDIRSLRDRGKLAEAEVAARRWASRSHAGSTATLEGAEAFFLLGTIYRRMGEQTRAEVALRQAMKVSNELRENGTRVPSNRQEYINRWRFGGPRLSQIPGHVMGRLKFFTEKNVASSFWNAEAVRAGVELARLLVAQGREPEARSLAIALYRELPIIETIGRPPNTGKRISNIFWSYPTYLPALVDVGWLSMAIGEYELADYVLRFAQAAGSPHKIERRPALLAAALEERAGDYRRARRHLEQARTSVVRRFGKLHASSIESLLELASFRWREHARLVETPTIWSQCWRSSRRLSLILSLPLRRLLKAYHRPRHSLISTVIHRPRISCSR